MVDLYKQVLLRMGTLWDKRINLPCLHNNSFGLFSVFQALKMHFWGRGKDQSMFLYVISCHVLELKTQEQKSARDSKHFLAICTFTDNTYLKCFYCLGFLNIIVILYISLLVG